MTISSNEFKSVVLSILKFSSSDENGNKFACKNFNALKIELLPEPLGPNRKVSGAN